MNADIAQKAYNKAYKVWNFHVVDRAIFMEVDIP